MHFNFAEAIKALGPGAAVRIANAARPPDDYLFATLLPERQVPDYTVKDAFMMVRATVAGLVGMDSPYPPGGAMELSTFLETAAKIANEVPLTEEAIRQLQSLVMRDWIAGGASLAPEALADLVLNFVNKIIVQPHLDTFEYLRGQALTTGKLDWTFNGIPLKVDYGMPVANLLTKHTGSTDSWYGSAPKFWDDVRAIYRKLGTAAPIRFIANSVTINDIIFNEKNNIRVVAQDGAGNITVVKFRGTTEQYFGDARERLTLTAYDREADILNPATPGVVSKIKFMPDGLLLAVAPTGPIRALFIGQGGTDNPLQQMELGYTHIAPTVEGGGAMGRWARVFIPEGQPWSLRGQGVTNGLPVLRIPQRVVVASSDLSTDAA